MPGWHKRERTVAAGDLTPSTSWLPQVLVALLLRCAAMVQTGEIIDELWGPSPAEREGCVTPTSRA